MIHALDIPFTWVNINSNSMCFTQKTVSKWNTIIKSNISRREVPNTREVACWLHILVVTSLSLSLVSFFLHWTHIAVGEKCDSFGVAIWSTLMWKLGEFRHKAITHIRAQHCTLTQFWMSVIFLTVFHTWPVRYLFRTASGYNADDHYSSTTGDCTITWWFPEEFLFNEG